MLLAGSRNVIRPLAVFLLLLVAASWAAMTSALFDVAQRGGAVCVLAHA